VPYGRGTKWQRRSGKNGFDVAAAGSQLVGVVFLASEVPRYLVDYGEPRRGGGFQDADRAQL
jgi:hypothetical protein